MQTEKMIELRGMIPLGLDQDGQEDSFTRLEDAEADPEKRRKGIATLKLRASALRAELRILNNTIRYLETR